MKKTISVFLVLCLMLAIFPFGIFDTTVSAARTTSYELEVGDTKLLILDAPEDGAYNGVWTSNDPFNVSIESQDSYSCRIKVNAMPTYNPVIIQCVYHYILYVGQFPYVGTSFIDFKITVTGDSISFEEQHKHEYQPIIEKKATLTETGVIAYRCSCGLNSSMKSTLYHPTTFELSNTSYSYNGKVRTPSVTVRDFEGYTISPHHYSLTKLTNCKDPGTHKIAVEFKNNYSGTKILTFKIESQLKKVNGVWKCYNSDGTINKANTLAKHTDGKYYHVNGGKLVKDTTLVKYNNKWHHVKNGVKSTYTGLFKYNGKWYHIKNGVKTNSTTLVKYNNKWYHVKNGVKSTYTGLFKYNGKWYHIKNGVKTNSTTLVKYKNTWYYVKNGVKNNSNTLCKYNNKWYHVKGGKFVKDTAIVKYGAKKYYVKGGIKTNATGKVRISGKTYRIKNGVVV